MRLRGLCCALAASVLCACSGQVNGKDAGEWQLAAEPLALSERDWNPNKAELPAIAAVSEDGDAVIVWGGSGASVLAGGALTASDASVTDWRFAARIPAPDATGMWPVAIDGKGRLFRLRALRTLELVSDRYGLLDADVRALAALRAPAVAFGLGKQIALADGTQVTRYALPSGGGLAAGGQQLAAIDDKGDVQTFDTVHHSATSVPLADARAALYMEERLFVQTEDAVFEVEGGGVSLRYRARDALHGMVLAGGRIWLAEGTRLCTLDATKLACSAGKSIAADAVLSASASGDVWVLAGGALTRFGVPVEGDEADWQTNVFPVYARVCSACHAPGGTAGVDLSSYAAWRDRRDKVYDQVIVKRAMPPDRALPDEDSAAIEAWSAPK